jgi:hypothetical protein
MLATEPFVGHVNDLNLGGGRKQRLDQVMRAAVARRAVCELVGALVGKLDQVLDGFGVTQITIGSEAILVIGAKSWRVYSSLEYRCGLMTIALVPPITKV